MILPNNTTVAVVNGETLKLFRNKAHEPQIRLVALPTPELEVHNQGSGMRHLSRSANPDDRRLEEDNFASTVAKYINDMVLKGEFSPLFIIADPRTLGELRLHYHASVAPILVGELDKDLIHQTTPEIEAALANA